MKDLKISTELASAVLGKEVTKCSLISTARNSINITYFEDKEDFNTVWKEWNIYEFAIKCKVWAIKKEFIVHSSPTHKIEFKAIVQKINMNHTYYGQNQFYALTEIEAIIKACEWILENLKEKI